MDDMPGKLIGVVLYLFTMLATFSLAIGLTIVLGVALVECRHLRRHVRTLAMAGLLAAGFAAGGAAGWTLRPFEWNMGLLETAHASVDAERYGHNVESKAERVFLYFLFTADLGAAAAGIAGVTALKRRLLAA